MKIINVGLPKTGTTTLHLFLSKFFNSTHHCRNKTLKMKNNLEKGENIYEGISGLIIFFLRSEYCLI